MPRRRIAWALLLAVLLAAGGCSAPAAPESAPAGEETVSFTDSLGQEFTLPRPRRVATLIGSFADIWLLAGGEDSLAATANDAWESYGLELGEGVASIGSGMKPSAELVLAARPDFILASSISSSNLELQETFRQAGIPAAYFDVASFDDYLELLELCARLTGCPERYELYGAQVKARADAALARQDGSAPTVLAIQVSGRSCVVKGSGGNVLGELLSALGCVNIADREGALLEDLSLEAIIQADPDYIFAVHHGTDTAAAQENLEASLLSNPAWAGLRAVREGRFYTMDRRLFSLKPNALWGEAYETLADILYPAA
ncbi:MAG: ABC transporter substrate-binding protein [Oscillospiraceae bacterium]|nr:ABC transporter substrate-binding protein [Oscillospiraceae bacterium]